MKLERIKKLKPEKFKRRFGVKKETYNLLVEIVKKEQNNHKRGRKSKLTVSEQILVTLEYLREYRTYFHISEYWNISESTVCRTVHKIEKILLKSGYFSLGGKKELIKKENEIKAVLIDVTEIAIERPKKRQKIYYSGKKKEHTFKAQLVVNKDTLEIICYVNGRGREHDFKIFKNSRLPLSEKIKCLVDKGYQGIEKIHKLSEIPKKKTKKRKLTQEEKRKNRELNRQRIVIEHVNRKLKIFRILSEKYRNKRKRFGLRFNLIAGIYNYEIVKKDIAII
ncbi:IS5 family transposase [Geminocystis sp. NIES-3709]|uniref:IS5 family transposase n=1 Tax=Geminocystis sp. NIES-3709 TaxID=1617448 RepID=UPI0005FC9A5E|nr:IS5 family transposase [Geminocystis sp. NIES-3709]BAQ63342.1 mobile element protein [Geminocystis sp. NIES-3709]BAQ63407.1 mobile element protein [Geminocystis sp. NIES-3709]BAQ64023.1 mobile element protein [Geminocystis sp. NIES-3709]BAQ64608.1 mobile element protein [Geminocystis sp. NIES-3709]BAQ64631.1 mobile element protein [Geminocystis sp. NIES-3709]